MAVLLVVFSKDTSVLDIEQITRDVGNFEWERAFIGNERVYGVRMPDDKADEWCVALAPLPEIQLVLRIDKISFGEFVDA